MKEPLLDKIKEEMPEYKISGLRNLLIIVCAILQKETCNLYKLRGMVGQSSGKTGSKPSSHYQRTVRFFKDYSAGKLWLDLLCLCFGMLRMKAEYLALDGTSWQYGSRKIHLLMLCVVYKGVAIPVYWHDLAKQGASSSEERQKMFAGAMEKLNLKGKTLLADREYIGAEWFKFLMDSGIGFIIRLKKGAYKDAVNQSGGARYSAMEKKVLRSGTPGKAVAKDFVIDGMALRIVMAKNLARDDKDAVIYLISSMALPAKKVSAAYFIRWRIETCFKHMKSNGFEMERINFEDKDKARLLIAMMVAAYTLSVLEGLKDYKDVPVKKYKDGACYKAVSAFREGIDAIAAVCNHFKKLAHYLNQQIQDAKKAYRNPKAIFV
jgi:hypothetical protein